VVNQDHTAGPLPKRRAEHLSRMHQRRRLCSDGYLGVEKVVILSVQKNRPEVLFVVVVFPQEILRELCHGDGRAQSPRRGSTALPYDGPRCELQPIAPRRHQCRPSSSDCSSAPPVASPEPPRPPLLRPRNTIRSARTSAVMCLLPRASAHTRVWRRPSTRTVLPLRRCFAARAPNADHATTWCHSVCRSRSPLRFVTSSCVAIESRVTVC